MTPSQRRLLAFVEPDVGLALQFNLPQEAVGKDVESRACMAGQGEAQSADWPRLAGAWGLPEACSGADGSLQRASWPMAEPAWFRRGACVSTRGLPGAC